VIRVDSRHLRFLVIDDNVHMRRIVKTLLNTFGSREIYEAEDGAMGLAAFMQHLPDIVILDWVMPIIDGIELTQMIRQPGANANPHTPIIMLTCHTEKAHVVAARDAGITEFLAKPLSANALHGRILNIISNPRPFIKSKTYFGPDRRRHAGLHHVGPERRNGGARDAVRPADQGSGAAAGAKEFLLVADKPIAVER